MNTKVCYISNFYLGERRVESLTKNKIDFYILNIKSLLYLSIDIIFQNYF
jgi:hypothetical protein